MRDTSSPICCINAQLFFQFAVKRIPRLFTFFDLAAGKLPFQRHGLVAGALADQYFPVLKNQSRYDSFHA